MSHMDAVITSDRV